MQVSHVDKLGFITVVECLVCGQQLSAACRKSKYYFERITKPAVLERGDHIGWFRSLGYWHHGIVTRQGTDRVAVVGYTIRNNDRSVSVCLSVCLCMLMLVRVVCHFINKTAQSNY